MLQVLGIKSCNTIKKTRDWLESKDVAYRFRDLRKEPLSAQEFAQLVKKAGLDALANRRGRTWRILGLSDKVLSDHDLFDVMLEHQAIIRRPVLVKGEALQIGFDEDALEYFLQEEE